MSLHLNLSKSSNLFGPGLVVEKIHKNGSKEYSELPHAAFYEGQVKSDPNSIVAISNHNGLVSMFTSFLFKDSNAFTSHFYSNIPKI